jgi:ataxin-3
MDLVTLIYHEKQDGQLCAQHCINNLLQGNYFTPTDLSTIAQQLDEVELSTLIQGDPSSIERITREFKSHNYDDSGFFSVQVIQKALQVWNLELVSITSSHPLAVGAKTNPETSAAFICNLEEHWFTLRQFGGSPDRWYNLNSVSKEPTYVTRTYLKMFLQQLQTEGYSIFLVMGDIPNSSVDQEAALMPVPQGPLRPNSTSNEDSKLQKAIQMSLGEDEELQTALRASMLDGDVDDESLRIAMQASLETFEQKIPPLPKSEETLDEVRRKRLARFG